MAFSPDLAERRFGYGLSPYLPRVASRDALLDTVIGPDVNKAEFPIPGIAYIQELMTQTKGLARKAKAAGDTEEGRRLRKMGKIVNRDLRFAKTRWFNQTQLRRIHGSQNFRERLVAFWGDHLTAQGKRGLLRRGTSPYLEDVIRPHVAGRFGDMLVDAVTHPLMLHYLDQARSFGPNSASALQEKGIAQGRGLNENLAREVLELHTLGVGGPYTQRDVRELAELLTGLGVKRGKGLRFRESMAEPGVETVLGKTYGPDPSLAAIKQVLHDLASHPATAAHLARKLVVHFVSDVPDAALVDHITQAYLANDGALLPVYRALIEHPATWQTDRMNIRPPVEFVSTSLRALAVPAQAFEPLSERDVNEMFFIPMRAMGQIWQKPSGPDGWPEEDENWVTPQGLASRLDWAAQMPSRLMGTLPDPRKFVFDALGPRPPERVAFAAKAAESRAVAVALILTSPAMQRR